MFRMYLDYLPFSTIDKINVIEICIWYNIDTLLNNEANIESVVNTRVVGFPKENNFSRVDNWMCTSLESNNCFLLYRNYFKMFNTLKMCCFGNDNKIS